MQWAPYIDRLPVTTSTVLTWTPQQVKAILLLALELKRKKAKVHTRLPPQLEELKGSPLTGYAQQLRAFGAACVADAMAVVEAGQAVQLVPQGAISREAVVWGLSMVLTRVIRMQSRGGDEVTEMFFFYW